MKVYISMDAEGISGIFKLGQVMSSDKEYEFARRMMANDVNAAVRGAFNAGAEQVVVNDAHNNGDNLLIDQLDERVDLISGALRPLGMAEGAELGFDAAFLIGYHRRKGGKGVATSLGVLLLNNWQIGLICLVFALVLMILTRMVSVGSCAAAVLFPVLTLFINEHYTVLTEGKSGSVYFIYSVILAVIVLYNHRSNIKRILNGTENKISFSK